MEQKIPEDLKKYDTPEARQAYQSYKETAPQTIDHGSIPQELWAFDTAQTRQEYQAFKLNRQMNEGLTTSDRRTFRLTPEQVSWVSDRYAKSWKYGHDDVDLEAKANGYLPPSMYSKYKTSKSQYDQWALQVGMPSEKDLEKYLKEYDEWKVQYAADEAAYNTAVATRKNQETLMESFFNDVADRMYRAEFNGVQRGSDEWNDIFFATMSEPQYSELQALNSDLVKANANATEKTKKTSKKKTTEQGEVTVAAEPTQEEIDAIVADKGYYFPTVPELSFSLADFRSLYDRGVTASADEHGYGKVNSAVRDAAKKIGFTEETSIPAFGTMSQWVKGDGTTVSQGSSQHYVGSGSTKGGVGGSFGQGSSSSVPASGIDADSTKATPKLKLANQTDTAAFCKDLVLGGYNSDDYWSVIGGLTAGTPTSDNPYGPGFYFNDATQDQIYRYGNVVSTRYGADLLNLIVNDASDEQIQEYVAQAVSKGATQELLTRAYDVAMDALGGGSTATPTGNAYSREAMRRAFGVSADEYDTSRDWDGLSYKERAARDKAFKKRFDAALSAAPSIPIGSGWTGKYETKEDVDKIVAQREQFDFDEKAKEYGLKTLRQTVGWGGSDYTGTMSADELVASVAETSDANKAAVDRFREEALSYGYSNWEVDQYLQEQGYMNGMLFGGFDPEHYREYLLETVSGDPFAVEYVNSISESDLELIMLQDANTKTPKDAWTMAPAIMLARGMVSYAASAINFVDMLQHGGSKSNQTGEIAEGINRAQTILSSVYKHDNQSPFIATITDAGSELARMYLVAQTGGAFGKAFGSALEFMGAGDAAAWIASGAAEGGSKAAQFTKWAIESVPFITGAMGSSYAEARSEGATNQQAVQYGVLAGLVEGLTEKVSAELIIGEGGSKVVNWAVGKLMNSGAKGLLKGIPGVLLVNGMKLGLNALIEGSEEGASYALDLLLKKAIYNPNEKWSWSEFGSQVGMGALCGALGLAFQNYGASYVQSMMEFAVSSPENMQTFVDFAVKQYGVNLGTDGNHIVTAEDFDVKKILPTSEFNEAWKNYLDAGSALSAAQKQYEAAVSSLDEDDAQKARDVMFWKNQVAAMDPNDAKSASNMAHAMEQLTIAESKAADTAKKNRKLRQDARTELGNARKRAQNAMDESSAKIRAHCRAEIAATLGAADTSMDSSYDLMSQGFDVQAEQENLEQTQSYVTAISDALSALDALEQADAAQKAAKAKLYDEAVSAFAGKLQNAPVVQSALETVNRLAQMKETEAADLDASADAMSAELAQASKHDEMRTAAFANELDLYDNWYGSALDQIDAEVDEAREAYRDGKITREQYEAAKARATEQIQAALNARDEQRSEAAVSFAADGSTSVAMQGLADAMRLEAEEARAKADSIRNAVVRALALRTQEAAYAALDEVQTGEGVLTVEQREAMSDELNQIVADQLAADEATKTVYDALEGIKLLEEQAEQGTAEAPENASEAQEAAVQSTQETTPATAEERRAELDKAVAVGKALGVNVEIVDDLPSELSGKYLPGGRILISKNAGNAPMQVLVHEMAHYIEGTAAYDQLQQYVFGVMAQDPDFNLSAEVAAYRALYAQAREQMGEPQLSDEAATAEARAEIVSRWCEKNLFTSEQSINNLCASQQSLGKRILNGIQNMLSGKRKNAATKDLQTAEKLYIKALNKAKAFGGSKVDRNSVVSLLVGSGLYVDTDGGAFKVYRTRYDAKGNRTSIEELKPNMASPCDGPITTDDIMNHSPIGAFIRLGQKHGNIEGFRDYELEPGTNLRAIPTDKLSTAGRLVNLFTDLSNMCLAYGDNNMVWDFVGGYVFSAITSNSDPQYSRTVDFGTICRKTQNLVTAMSEAMVTKGRGLYADEIIELQNQMINGEAKIDAPCSMCYVFNRWLGLGGYLNRVKVYQDRYSAMTPQQAFKAFQEVQAQLESIVHPADGAGNYEELIKDLAAKHGLDAKTYLDEIAKVNRSFGEKGWVRGRKNDVTMSDARARSIKIYAQFLEDCMSRYDLRGVKDPTKLKIYNEIQQRMELTDAYGWFTKVLLNEDKKGNFKLKSKVLSKDGSSWATGADGNASFVVPTDVLFNLNASDQFATQYPDVWKFRTSGGSALGKATYGYTDARLGEFTYGAAVSSVKSQEVAKAPRYGIGSETSNSKNQPKNKLSFVNSRGEFASGGEKTFMNAMQNVLNQAWLGGDRMQSSSDYTSKNALDYLLTAFEMQCLGAPVQTYSKVPEGLAFFDAIGASANISLIGKGKGYNGTVQYTFDENSGRWKVSGNGALDFSTIQGVDPEVARALSSVSDHLQPIVVGMNREHAALVLSTPWITMCIPVHMSGGTVDNISARAVAQGDPALTKADINDATDSQNDKALNQEELVERYGKEEAGKKLLAREIRKGILSGTLTEDLAAKIDLVDSKNGLLRAMYEKFQESGAALKMSKDNPLGVGIYPNEYWDTTSTIENADVNGDRFQEYCEMLGVLPRFSYGNYGEQGTLGEPGYFPGLNKLEGYWKVLIDRKMFNVDGSYRTVGGVDVSGLTANMLNGTSPTSLSARLNAYYADAANSQRRDAWFSKTYDSVGRERPSTGSHLFNADENARLQAQQAAAADVGREYGQQMTGNAAEAMDAHARYALSGDVDAKLAEFRKQFGAMPTSGAETAPGRENVVLPKQTNEDTYVRRAAQTFMRSPNVTDAAASDIGRAVIRGEFDYERQSNEETASRAERMMQDLGGQVGALQHLENVARGAARPSAETVALGEQLILDAMEIGDANAFEKAVAYTAMIGTAAGQTTQAFSMINKLSPQGIALYMTRVIERLNNVEYKDLIAKGKMKPIQLTEDQVARIMNVKSFSEARQVETKILEEIGAQIPLTLKEQLRSWRYLCMLGNVRTNVRNLAGNVAMASLQMSKNTIAAGLEAWDVKRGAKLASKAAAAERAGNTAKAERLSERAERHLTQSDRTKALRFGSNADLYKTNLAYAKGTTADALELLKGGGKDVGLSALQSGKRMFNAKWLNKVGQAAMKPLDVGDLLFSKPHYEHAYAQWMTAKGLTGEDMTLKQRNEAMKYAVNEAQKATFRDANWLATKITEIRSRNLASELIVGGIMPFAKTPANILRRGIEYSPAGLIQGITQLVKANNAADLSRSERMQMRAAAIDRMASGVSGTGLMAIGMLLRSLGVLRGKDDDDKRVAGFAKDMGYQPYSIKIGKDTSMTIDWLAPLNMPMFMGAAIWDAAEKLSEGEELNLKDIADPILSIADPMIEMSMLSGIQSALKTYGSENALSAVATNTLQSFAGQFYPTIGGQLARTIDLTRRSPDSKHYWIQSMAAKIPGLSKTVKPYVGGYGDEEEFDPTDSTFANYLLRAFEQFIMPGYIKTERNDELTKELFRLYESTGVNSYLPQRPSDYKKLNLGKQYGTRELTYDEQVEYEKLFRSEAAKALDSAIKSSAYKGLSDADKADLLTEVYQQATKNARKTMKETIMKRYNIGGVAATQKP